MKILRVKFRRVEFEHRNSRGLGKSDARTLGGGSILNSTHGVDWPLRFIATLIQIQ